MLYCTKCKKFVPGGDTLCPDCGSLLVIKAEDELEENRIPIATEAPEVVRRIAEYLKYSGLEGVETLPDEDGEAEHLLVRESDYREAVRMLAVYNREEARTLAEEAEAGPEEDGEEDAEEFEPAPAAEPVRPYVKQADRRADVHSSGVALVTVGFAVLIFLFLAAMGVIPLSLTLSSKIISGSVMGVMGLFFVIYGFLSLKKARDMAADVVEEEELTEDIEGWFLRTFSAEDIDADLTDEEGELTEAERQLGRLAAIRTAILDEYEIADESFVDALCETLYQKLYEN